MFYFVSNIAKTLPKQHGHQALARFAAATFKSNVGCGKQSHSVQSTFGQPTFLTHPHLVKKDEVLPGIKLDEVKHRRDLLMENILNSGYVLKNPGCTQIVIIPSATKVYMSGKIPYVFRQNTDFLYFTGCQEPDSILLIAARDNGYTSTLFVRKKDEHLELWDGPRTGVEAACAMFGVDQALPVDEFERHLISLINGPEKCIVWYDKNNAQQPQLRRKLTKLTASSKSLLSVSPNLYMHQTRLIKSPAEVRLMQRSCDVASNAIAQAMRISKPGISEHRLSATVDYECRMNGAEYLAYPPVVAAGKNANVIHYIRNDQVALDGEMVLMDAGCEYHGYTSDITRTWPVGGTFSSQQRVIYEIVLEVQKLLIERLRQLPTLDHLFQDMCLLLGERLQEVGLIPKDLQGDKLIPAAYAYCPHHVAHYLGMDVHDTGEIPRSIPIQAGMIVTVEPGVYVSPKNSMAPPEFYNLGVRIEDDVLIGDDGPLVLSRKCPKELDEIEALIQAR